jgi:hypothetical protein
MSKTRPTQGQSGDEETPDPETDVGSESERRQLSQNEIFEMLSSNRRRYVLHHLKRKQGPAELGELAEQIASRENNKPLEEVRSTERKNAYTALRQFHLPKMADKGVVRFDKRKGTVELSEQAADLDIYLDVVSGYDVPWSLYYTAISIAFATLLVCVNFAFGPFAEVSVAMVAALFVVTIFLFSLLHTYTNKQMRIGSSDLLE